MLQGSRATSGEAFRAMLFVVVAIAIALGLAGWFVYAQTTHALERQVRSRIIEDFHLIEQAYSSGGDLRMIDFVNAATATRGMGTFAFGLFGPDGKPLAGTITALPDFVGWGVIDTDATGAGSAEPILCYSANVGGHLVVAGRSLGIMYATGSAVLQALAIAGLSIGFAALVTAYLFGRVTSQKLKVMARTLDQVSRGDSTVRLPVGRQNDQIDYVSRQINGHLDRLSDLMMTMRNTATAIAHDLRSPMNRMSILLQEAEQAKTVEQWQDYLHKTEDELADLLSTLDTILRISRIEASDDMSGFRTVALSPLLADLVETYEPVMETKGQTIRLIGAPGDVAVFGDRRMLQQLLVNLIENAGRYAGEGAHVEVAANAINGAPTITIADNGPGIPAEHRAKVFEPFFRLNPERNALGTGLGLALVRVIATRHRAEITLSDNGPGLKVTLVFPAPPRLA